MKKEFTIKTYQKIILLSIVVLINSTVVFSSSYVTLDNVQYEIDTNNNFARAINAKYVITDLTIPNEIEFGGIIYPVTEIGDNAFINGAVKGNLILGQNIKKIGNRAFYNCPDLTGSLILPNSIEELGEETFRGVGCDGVLQLSEALVTIPRYAFLESGFSRIEFGESSNIKQIGREAFESLSNFNMEELVLPNNLSQIGNKAFNKTNFSLLIIPSSVETIGYMAFNNQSLTKIACISKTPSSINKSSDNDDKIFSETTYNSAKLYISPDAQSAYSKADGWKYFKSINDFTDLTDLTESLSVTPNNVKLNIFDSEQLKVEVFPNFLSPFVTFSVLPSNIIQIDNSGKIVAINEGNAVITITCGNISATCNVEVKGDDQGGGSEEPNTGSRILFMEPGQQLDIRSYFDYTTEVQPLAVLMDYYEFETSDPEVVDGVSQDGGFEAKKYGMANLKVSYINKMDNTKIVNNFLVLVCPSITVEHGSGVIYSHHVVYNSTPTLPLKAGNGYRIAGATHGEKDIYDEIIANDGKYVPAEPIKENTVINLALEEAGNSPTTVADTVLNDPNIRILVHGHTVNITGVPANTVVRMYNLGGKMLFDHVIYPNIEVIDAGVYLIEIDGQPNVYRILVK